MAEQILARGAATRAANKNLRRERILASAGEIIVEDGLDGMTLSKIAARAEVTIPTVHNLIGKKEEIYALLVERMVGQVAQALATRNSPDPICAAESFIESLISVLASNEALYKAAFMAGERIGFFNQNSADGIYRQSLELAQQVCVQAIERGDLRGRIDSDAMAKQIFACQRLARHDWTSGHIDLPGYRRQVLTGMFITYAADAAPQLRARLESKLNELS